MPPTRRLVPTLLFSGCLLFATAVALAAESQTPSVAAESRAEGPWLGPDGQPLPFDRADELLDFLATAPITATKKLSDGINKPLRLTLERDGITLRAVWRTVDVEREEQIGSASSREHHFRDSYIFEVAAYELDRMLGLGRVPPAAPRRIDGQQGSVQLWVEKAMSEAHRLEERLDPPGGASAWQKQRQTLFLFDNLIYNFDRNHGNMLLDEKGKLWFVDHTRSFKRVPMLPDAGKIAAVERGLWQRLRELDPGEIRERLKPYLGAAELGPLLKRRELLIEHIETLIAERGETDVLFELSEP